MNLTNLLLNETFITSVVFNDEAVEITFMEKGQQASRVMQINTIAFPIDGEDPEKVDIVAAIQDLLRELVDRAYGERRAEHNGEKRKALLEERAISRRDDLLELPDGDDEV